MNIRVRALDNIRAVAAEPTPEDLALLAAEDYAGSTVTAAEVRVREMLLCHDQYDRTYERFPRAYLDRFAVTLPGKSMLPGHDTSELPLARFFRADIQARREGEFPVLIQPEKSAGVCSAHQVPEEGCKACETVLELGETKAEVVPGFQPRRRNVSYLRAGFYYPNDEGSAALDNRIRLGVYRSVSLGFRYDDLTCDLCKKSYFRDCPHIIGYAHEPGDPIPTGTYGGNPEKAEALEGSIVYLGAQPQARLIKSMVESGRVDPQRLAYTPFGEDLVALKEAEGLARRYGHEQKSWAINPTTTLPESRDSGDPASARAAADVEQPDPEAQRAEESSQETAMKLLEAARKHFGLAETATEEEAEKALETAAAQAKRVTDAEAAKTAAEDKVKQLEPRAAIGDAALADVRKDYVDHCARLGQDEAEAGAVAELFVTRGDYAGLKALAGKKFEAVCAKFPTTPSARTEEVPPARAERPADYMTV